MSRGKLCVCCNQYQVKANFEKGNMCRKCVNTYFKPAIPKPVVYEGVQLPIDL